MCLETATAAHNSGGQNDRKSGQIQLTVPRSLRADTNDLPKLKVPKRANSYTFPEENDSLTALEKERMAEKKKRLPPGYVNVSTKPLPGESVEEEGKVGKGNIYYVNTEVNTEDELSRNQIESRASHIQGTVGIETSAFKFQLDPTKPEIPISESHPLSKSPLQQKLSPQNTLESNQRNSGEFPSNNSQCIRNEISRPDEIRDTDEIKEKEKKFQNSLWIDGSINRSLSSTFCTNDFSKFIDEPMQKIYQSEPNFDIGLESSPVEFSSNRYKDENDKCNISSISFLDDPFWPSNSLDQVSNKENIFFDEARLQPSSPLKRPNSYQNVSLTSPLQDTQDLKPVVRHQNLPSNKKLEISLSSDQQNSDSSLKQYIHSAGGGCVSPIGDASPHILITSQNYFPYGKPSQFGNPSHNFSDNNPFLSLIRKEKESESIQSNKTNPFVWTTSQAKENKSQIEIHTMSQNTFSNPASFLKSQDVANAINTPIFRPNTTSTSNNPTHIHHHHFHHPDNQARVQINIGWNDTLHNQRGIDVEHTISFTPPPSIDFPSSSSNSNGRANVNMSDVDVNQSMQLVLKPKKNELSYKDLEKILLLNKALLKKCGWYYGKMKADESTALLRDTKPGTFLVRDSSDPKYWFSLSMQRGNATSDNDTNSENSGPTSIRIHFVNGKFQLDAEDRIRSLMPEFDTIIDLVQFYVSTSLYELKQVQEANLSCTDVKNKSFQNAKSGTLWVDSSGKLYQTIFLAYPLYRKDSPQSLSQMCRLTINKSLVSKITNDFSENIYKNHQYQDSVLRLNLPVRMKQFLQEYPNTI